VSAISSIAWATGMPFALSAVPISERDCAGLGVGAAGDQHERHLLPLRGGIFFCMRSSEESTFGPDPALAQPRCNLVQVADLVVGDRDTDRLDRRQPGRNAPA